MSKPTILDTDSIINEMFEITDYLRTIGEHRRANILEMGAAKLNDRNELAGDNSENHLSRSIPIDKSLQNSDSLIDTNLVQFTIELTKLINNHSLENLANIPDFILAEFLQDCLLSFCKNVNKINKWYSR